MNVQFRDFRSRPRPPMQDRDADCDIHPRARPKPIYPYPAKAGTSISNLQCSSYQGMMTGPPYPKAQPNAARRDAYPPEGGPQVSSLSFMQQQISTEPCRARRCSSARHRAGHPHHELAARSVRQSTLQNREMDQQGLPPEGSIVVATRMARRPPPNPQARARTEFVQVLLLSRTVEPLASAATWPIYEAAEESGFRSACCLRLWRQSDHASGCRAFTSRKWGSFQCSRPVRRGIVLEGVFERHPNSR